MTYELTVCINDIVDNVFAASSALSFSEDHQARLTAVYVKLDEVQIRRWASSSPNELTNKLVAEHNKREGDAVSLFESIAESYNCECIIKTVYQSDDPFKQIMCTDFIFASQPSKDSFFHRPDDQFITHLLLKTKRPVLMIPNGWKQRQVGEKIVIGWNDSTEAMRAIADAMPLLQNAKEVNLLKILKQNRIRPAPLAYPDIRAYLDAKGVTNTILIQRDDEQIDEYQQLVNFAHDCQSDLIVIGGYSHSRLHEVVFGGVTKHLLAQSNLPILVSH